jgi:hypothetical protein
MRERIIYLVSETFVKTKRGEVTYCVTRQREHKFLHEYVYPLAERNLCDEHGNTLKPATVQYYNAHVGRWTIKPNDKVTPSASKPGNGLKGFSSPVRYDILNSWIPLNPVVVRYLRLVFIRDLQKRVPHHQP